MPDRFGCRLNLRAGNSSLLTCAVVSVLLGGCAAAPKGGHVVLNKGGTLQNRFMETYAVQESLVTITATETGEGDKKKTTVTGTYDRTEHPGYRIALLRDPRIGIRTNVTIKRFENTDIPSVVTVKVEDGRAELIKKTGEFAIQALKLIGVAAAGDDIREIEFPIQINLTQAIGTDGDPAKGYQIQFGDVPPDAIARNQLDGTRADSFFYYAACRTAIVSFKYRGKEYSFSYKVSDPAFLQRVRMPLDGKITMHSQCGASVEGTLAGDDMGSALAIASALTTQAQAIKDAVKEADEEEDGE